MIMNNTVHVQLESIKNLSATPVLTYCRKLMAEGHVPTSRLEIYRGEQLALIVHEIGKGAMLTVDKDTTKFKKYKIPKF